MPRDNAPFLGGCEPARQLSLQPVVAVGADDEGNDPRTCSVASVSQKTPVSGGDLRQFVAFWG